LDGGYGGLVDPGEDPREALDDAGAGGWGTAGGEAAGAGSSGGWGHDAAARRPQRQNGFPQKNALKYIFAFSHLIPIFAFLQSENFENLAMCLIAKKTISTEYGDHKFEQ